MKEPFHISSSLFDGALYILFLATQILRDVCLYCLPLY